MEGWVLTLYHSGSSGFSSTFKGAVIKLGPSGWASSLRVRWLATIIACEAMIPFGQVRCPMNHYSACHKPLVCAGCGASWCWGEGEVGLKMMLMVRSWNQSCRRIPTMQCGWWLGSWQINIQRLGRAAWFLLAGRLKEGWGGSWWIGIWIGP